MFSFNSIALKNANFVISVCMVIVFLAMCGGILSEYWFYIAEFSITVFAFICILLLTVILEAAFVYWLVKNIKLCNIKFNDLHDEWESIYENSQVGIAFLKGGRYFAKGNKRLANIFGYDSAEAMAGIDVRSIHLSDDNFHEFGEKYYKSLTYGARLHIEYPLKKKDGSAIWCQLSGKAIDKSHPADLDKGVVWIVEDISRRKKLEDDLRKLAELDGLTSLKNRRSFMTSAGVEFERFNRYNSPLSAIMIDIDDFKIVNDSYGHDAGDAVLIKFADICREQFRGTDVVGRIGGEEFAILLPTTSCEQTVMVAERLRRSCQQARIGVGNEKLCFTASFGVACAEEAAGVRDLLKQADQALYRAKRNGKDRVEVFKG